jgi:hypothetical protein
MSDWTKHVTKFYNEQKAGNPKYMFKQALKDAAKTYKKAAKPEAEAKPQKKNKRARTMKKKPRK